MIKINIKAEVTSNSEMADVLRNVANLIDEGYISGFNPTWELIDSTDRESKIEYIKRVLQEWGSTSTAELVLDSSPVYQNINGRICSLVEEFNVDNVRVITYDDETEINESYFTYAELSNDLIGEITQIIEMYEADCIQTEKRISN